MAYGRFVKNSPNLAEIFVNLKRIQNNISLKTKQNKTNSRTYLKPMVQLVSENH